MDSRSLDLNANAGPGCDGRARQRSRLRLQGPLTEIPLPLLRRWNLLSDAETLLSGPTLRCWTQGCVSD